MLKKSHIYLCVVVICLVLTSACVLPDMASGNQQDTAEEGDAVAVQDTAVPTDAPEATAAPTAIPSQPVPLFSGLASLDSYQSTLRIYSAGPGPNTLSETISEIQFNRATSATYNRRTSKSSDEEEPTLETQLEEQYTIGMETCSLDDGEWEYDKMEPQEKELLSIYSNLFDLLPVISNPVFVGAETKNGLAANHFTFKVESAGVESGSIVTVNEGEYWLAVDGQYLVAYSLHLQLRTGPEGDPEADVNTVEIEYSLENINQPMDIQLPVDCTP